MTLSLSTVFLAGILTFLSPCVLPLVPIYLAMLAGTSVAGLRAGQARQRTFMAALSFAAGIALVFVALGMAASGLGKALSGHRVLLAQLAGLAVFIAGLKLTGLITVPWLEREARPWLASVRRGTGLLWPLLLGGAFALGWSPCVGPVLGSVLVLAGSKGSAAVAALYLGVYAAGLTLPLLAVALAAPLALRLLDRAKRHLRRFEIASGALLAAVGLLFVTGHATAFLHTPTEAAPVAAATTSSPEPATCSAGPAPTAPPSEPAVPSAQPNAAATMVEFASAGCPICQRMKPVVAEVLQDCARHGVHVELVDVATPAGRARASQYGVLGVPTFLFLAHDGSEVARLVGQQPKELLVQSLEVLAGEKCDGFHELDEPGTPHT